MKCPFNNCENEDDILHFDDPMAHLIIVVNAKGHTHIHGPFDDEFLLRKMADALIAEMKKAGIDWTPNVIKERKVDNPLHQD